MGASITEAIQDIREGRMIPDPRLGAGLSRRECASIPVLHVARLVLEARYRISLGGPGLVLYRNGRDSVGFHSDDEMRYLDKTIVASLGLGATRTVAFKSRGDGTRHDVVLSAGAGETLAVVGESGSGKTMTFLSALGLVPPPGQVVGGIIRFDGEDLTTLTEQARRAIRGAGIAMVFQDPLTALNPVFTVGEQLSEALRAHSRMSKRAARTRTLEVLDRVHIPDPERRIDDVDLAHGAPPAAGSVSR